MTFIHDVRVWLGSSKRIPLHSTALNGFHSVLRWIWDASASTYSIQYAHKTSTTSPIMMVAGGRTPSSFAIAPTVSSCPSNTLSLLLVAFSTMATGVSAGCPAEVEKYVKHSGDQMEGYRKIRVRSFKIFFV